MARIGCVQLAMHAGEPPERRLTRAAELLVGERFDLVVLPELWPVGFFQFDRYAELAEPLEGPTVERIRQLAADLRTFLHGGSIVERRGDGRLSNTSILVDPEGELVLTYRKRHLFAYRSREASLLTPGEEADVVETPLGMVGMTTCFDLRFPELYGDLIRQGAEILVVTSAWPRERLGHWRLFTRTRALENLAYLVAANAAGTDAGVRLAGHSLIVDPWGEILAEAGEEEGVLVGELDPARVEEVRSEFPVLAERLAENPELGTQTR